MEEAVAVILEGVDEVPILGIPGSIVIFGETATPVFSNKKHEVLISAAMYGDGRLVAFPHSAYLNRDFYKANEDPGDKRLYQNVAKWVMANCFTAETTVVYAKDIDTNADISMDTLVIWGSGNIEDETIFEKLLDFMHNGGGMVVGTTPWGFLQNNPTLTLETIPVNLFIQKMGMCFTHRYYSSNEKVPISENSADRAHLLNALKHADSVECFTQCSATIQLSLSWLPDLQFCQIKDQVNNMIEMCSTEIHCCPVPGNPLTTTAEKALVTVICRAQQSYDLESCCVLKIPSVETFPGDLAVEHPLEECVEVCLEVPEHEMRCFHPTGYYVLAGRTLIIHLLEEPLDEDEGWMVAVGSHTDELFATDAPWRRWPTVQVTQVLKNKESTLRTPCGGLVYFISDKGTKAALNARIENVIQAPFYDVRNPGLKETWLERRKSPGLWADLVGYRIMLSLPASSIRELDDPDCILNFWDTVVEGHFSLATVDLNNRRREWVVTDEQPRAGYMHAGYPVVTELDVANPTYEGTNDAGLLNLQGLYTKGSWGMFHELGHNMQDSMWTFSGTGEVTCNIFTLHAMEILCEQKPWIHRWLQDYLSAAEEYLKAGAKFGSWQGNPGIALFIYAQLARDFGWDSYRAVFKQYKELTGVERPHGLQQQVDQWMTRFSKVAKKNLLPLFEFWGFPVTDIIRTSDLLDLPLYCLTDEFACMVPDRVAYVMAQYE